MKTENTIIRIPTKFIGLFDSLDNENSGKLIKAIFNENGDNLSGLNLTYYNLIMIDMFNIKKQVEQGKKGAKFGKLGGRPKKNPGGVIDENPKVKDKVKDKDKDKVKDKEKKQEPKKLFFGNEKVVKLTQDEYDKLVNDYGKDELENIIEDVENYVLSSGKKYKNFSATIRNFFKTKGVKSKSKLKNDIVNFALEFDWDKLKPSEHDKWESDREKYIIERKAYDLRLQSGNDKEKIRKTFKK